MALRRIGGVSRQAAGCWARAAAALALLGLLGFEAPRLDAATDGAPSLMEGLGKVVGGLVFEGPKTLLKETLENPPVVGTVMGLLAGVARALQVTASGIAEMSAAFDPWGTKTPCAQ